MKAPSGWTSPNDTLSAVAVVARDPVSLGTWCPSWFAAAYRARACPCRPVVLVGSCHWKPSPPGPKISWTATFSPGIRDDGAIPALALADAVEGGRRDERVGGPERGTGIDGLDDPGDVELDHNQLSRQQRARRAADRQPGAQLEPEPAGRPRGDDHLKVVDLLGACRRRRRRGIRHAAGHQPQVPGHRVPVGDLQPPGDAAQAGRRREHVVQAGVHAEPVGRLRRQAKRADVEVTAQLGGGVVDVGRRSGWWRPRIRSPD